MHNVRIFVSFCFGFLFFISIHLSAQNADTSFFREEIRICSNHVSYHERMRLDYGILYHDPQGFIVNYGYGLCLNPDKWIAQEYAALLESKDSQCVVFLPVLKEMHRDVWMTILSDFQLGFRMVFEHRRFPIHWDDYLTKVSGSAAKKKYNADTLYFYQLPDVERLLVYPENNPDRQVVMRQYPFNTKMILYTKGKRPFHLLFLFTPQGFENRREYIESFEHYVRFLPDV